MIRLIPATLSGTPNLYGVEISENICRGYSQDNMPSAVISVVPTGSITTAGGISEQTLTFSVTVTYQPDSSSTVTMVKTFVESIDVVVAGSATSITPTIGTGVNVTATKIGCCGKAHGVKLVTSVSVAFS